MAKKIAVGLALIVAGALIGHGIGEVVNDSGFQIIGLGAGILAAAIFTCMQK